VGLINEGWLIQIKAPNIEMDCWIWLTYIMSYGYGIGFEGYILIEWALKTVEMESRMHK
jgi:hypothetical protein